MKKSFSISPRILSHLGEDLIKSESIAILELVKNSYDACATYCEVNFITDANGKLESMVIKDDGMGMSIDVIENIWLTVGTDNKLKNQKPNKFGRIPLGEKGIGRLGVHKLGNNIQLFSKTDCSKEVFLSIDWNALSGAVEINDFCIELEEGMTNEFRNSTGTKIVITDLKSQWDRRLLREVYRALVSLNSPFENKNDDFKVNITSNSKTLFENLPKFEDIKSGAMYFGKCNIKGGRITNISYEFRPWTSLLKVENGRTKKTSDFNDDDLYLVDSSKSPI